MCGFEMIPLHLDFKNNDFFFPFVCLVRTKMLKWFNSQMNCQFSSCNEKDRSERGNKRVSCLFRFLCSPYCHVCWTWSDILEIPKCTCFASKPYSSKSKWGASVIRLFEFLPSKYLFDLTIYVCAKALLEKKKTLVIAYFLCNWRKWKIFLKCVLHMSRCFFLHMPRIFYGW